MTDDGPIPLDAFRRILRETPDETHALATAMHDMRRHLVEAAEEERLTQEWERAIEGADPPTAAAQFQAYDDAMPTPDEQRLLTPWGEATIRAIVRDELRRWRR